MKQPKLPPTQDPQMSFELWIGGVRMIYLKTYRGYYYCLNAKENRLKRISGSLFFHTFEEYKGF